MVKLIVYNRYVAFWIVLLCLFILAPGCTLGASTSGNNLFDTSHWPDYDEFECISEYQDIWDVQVRLHIREYEEDDLDLLGSDEVPEERLFTRYKIEFRNATDDTPLTDITINIRLDDSMRNYVAGSHLGLMGLRDVLDEDMRRLVSGKRPYYISVGRTTSIPNPAKTSYSVNSEDLLDALKSPLWMELTWIQEDTPMQAFIFIPPDQINYDLEVDILDQ